MKGKKLSKDDKSVLVSIRLPSKVVKTLLRDADTVGVTLSKFIRACIVKGRMASIGHFANRNEIG
jgi:hypothetical protein